MLLSQRRQLENASDDLHETDSYTARASSVMKSMSRRVMTDKLIQGVIILIQMGICALIVYFRYYRD